MNLSRGREVGVVGVEDEVDHLGVVNVVLAMVPHRWRSIVKPCCPLRYSMILYFFWVGSSSYYILQNAIPAAQSKYDRRCRS